MDIINNFNIILGILASLSTILTFIFAIRQSISRSKWTPEQTRSSQSLVSGSPSLQGTPRTRRYLFSSPSPEWEELKELEQIRKRATMYDWLFILLIFLPLIALGIFGILFRNDTHLQFVALIISVGLLILAGFAGLSLSTHLHKKIIEEESHYAFANLRNLDQAIKQLKGQIRREAEEPYI